MKLEQRAYSGRIFRPRPEIHCEPDGSLCIVATAWGPRSSARKVIQTIIDFFHSARSDQEVTSPFQTMTCLSPMANNLRVAVMLANDIVYREDNRSEYQTGVELVVVARHGRECVWAQVGGPFLLLDRPGYDLAFLSAVTDLALHHSRRDYTLPPLPATVLGLSSTTNLLIQSASLQPEDRFIMLHRTLVPPKVQTLPRTERDIQPISQWLARHSTDMPFWLGILSFD